MILAIFLLIFIVLSLALLIAFVFYVLQPSVAQKNKLPDNLLVNLKEASDFYAEQKKRLPVTRERAFVLRQNATDIYSQAISLNGQYTCSMLKSIYFTEPRYNYVCLGHGDCARVCEQKAIVFEDKVARVTDLCCGCTKCTLVCPQKIIRMLPLGTEKLPLSGASGPELVRAVEENSIDKNVEWKSKKYFKLWAFCYRMYKSVRSKLD